MKKNVLQYVQSALNVMDSDQVDKIADTEESMQVAELLRDLYFEMLERQDWSFLKGPVEITAAADTSAPTKLIMPEDLTNLLNLWYNISESGYEKRELCWVEPDEFVRMFGDVSSTTNQLLISAGNNIQFYVKTNEMPRYWTTFDDENIFCNAYDSDIESTLTGSRVLAHGVTVPTFTVSDNFVPDLPVHMVPLLQHTLNATASNLFKQMRSIEDEKREVRQLAQARRRNRRAQKRTSYYHNNFGRK